jgi:hypothetical protein
VQAAEAAARQSAEQRALAAEAAARAAAAEVAECNDNLALLARQKAVAEQRAEQAAGAERRAERRVEQADATLRRVFDGARERAAPSN